MINLAIGCLAQGTQSCQNGGNCVNTNGVGTCSCQLGYSGAQCQVAVGCVAGGTSKCINGGVCSLANGQCQCPVTYSGSKCEACNLKFY